VHKVCHGNEKPQQKLDIQNQACAWHGRVNALLDEKYKHTRAKEQPGSLGPKFQSTPWRLLGLPGMEHKS